MLDLMYRIPSDESISRCVISRAMVEANLAIEDDEAPKLAISKGRAAKELAS